jgi:membrane protein
VISFGFARLPLTWRELATRTGKEFVADNGLGLAAQLAYYFFFSLFPAILVGIALASFFPLERFLDRIVGALAGVVPSDVITIIQEQMRKISEGDHGGILTVGLVVALWSSSAAMMGLIDALNRAYDLEEARPWWKVRLLAVVLTLALAAFVLVAFALVLLGPTVADYVARATGLGPVFAWTWKVLQWPVVLALVALGAGMVYYFAPDAEQDWVWVTPGSVLATVLWLLASLGFKYYVTELRGLHGDVRRHRGRDGAPPLVLHLGARHAIRRRAERGDRARLALRQSRGREGPRPAPRHRGARLRALPPAAGGGATGAGGLPAAPPRARPEPAPAGPRGGGRGGRRLPRIRPLTAALRA